MSSCLKDFITRIRNCKTMAEERAEYQKEMAVIRQSFTKNEENLRPRNVTKLLFINMSGQQTDFGQMECLKLITGNTLIQKRIGYLGLTQLFHERSELLMMATNRIRVDLAHSNNNLVGLALCVLSEICTPELANQLNKQVLKCLSSKSLFVKKKAALTSIKLLKKAPEYLSEFLQKIIGLLQDKNHGVLLGCFAFLENAILLDPSVVDKLADLMPKYEAIYREVVNQYNSSYQISGVQDPFLQVAILRYLRTLKRYVPAQNSSFLKRFGEILVTSHDVVCSKITASNKNGPNAILFECFQCMMTIPSNANLSHYTQNVLTKFVSVKDANSKYLSLFNLGLIAKHDISIAKNYRSTIIQCLQQNDLLIRIMALDLLYLIAGPENVTTIVKELLNVLLAANDEQFISQLALKICLIVEKHPQSRRWHFDITLKVLILADKSVKEESAKSLVHLITSTPELQQYSIAKLFFSACQNPQNGALCQVTMYLLGEFSQHLLRLTQIEVNRTHIIDLIEQILFKPTVVEQTIEYGLSALFKLCDKFTTLKQRIMKIIKSFESHSDLQVQKRACEYTRLLDQSWANERKKQICIPIPAMRASAATFYNIPIGDTSVDLDPTTLKLPQKINIDYDEHIAQTLQSDVREVKISYGLDHEKEKYQPPIEDKNLVVKEDSQQFKKKKITSLLDDDDQVSNPPPPRDIVHQKKVVVTSNDPFDILGLDIGGNRGGNTNPNMEINIGMGNMGSINTGMGNMGINTGMGNMGGSTSTGGGDLLGGDFFSNQPSHSAPLQNQYPGQDLLGGLDNHSSNSKPFTFNTNGDPDLAQPSSNFNNFAPQTQVLDTYKFKGYENEHLQIWMQCRKQNQPEVTRIVASFMNKTPNYIDGIAMQSAVMKYLKIVIQPPNTTAMPASSKAAVKQILIVTNSSVGQKPILMKIKLSYTMNGQKFNYEAKIEGFPMGF